MLINIKQVAKMIQRDKSAVYKYIEKGFLPKSVSRHKTTRVQFWCLDEITKSMADVLEYQRLALNTGAKKPKPKKINVNPRVRPPETNGQMAANNAFNLCVNIA